MLTHTEADFLISMEKTFVQPVSVSIPPGADQTHVLIGNDRRERFFLDLWRGTLRLSKLKYQTRGRKVIVLVRLDIDGAPRTNPDGTRIGKSHIHIYREGYEGKWAYPVDSAEFHDLTDMQRAFNDFCRYCNIQDIPPFQSALI